MQPAVYLSHDEISQWIESIKHEILEHPFVAVVGILRGGGFPALCVSFSTGLPVFHIQYDRKTQRASWVGEPPPPGLLLVCEDFAGSGQTLLNSLLFIKETHECKTLTLISDELSRHQADWTRRYNGHRVILPWERHCHSPSHRQDWHSNQGRSGEIEMLEDEAYRYFAVDLDGVLCEDLPPALYHADLEACLLERDSLPLSAFAPSLMPSRHVVVTARPSEDSERTRLWLDKQGYHAISVHLRDPSSHSVSESAIHKGETATRLGCSDFIESDPRQAIEIAARFPHLRVTYWNEGNPILVSANQSKA